MVNFKMSYCVLDITNFSSQRINAISVVLRLTSFVKLFMSTGYKSPRKRYALFRIIPNVFQLGNLMVSQALPITLVLGTSTMLVNFASRSNEENSVKT